MTDPVYRPLLSSQDILEKWVSIGDDAYAVIISADLSLAGVPIDLTNPVPVKSANPATVYTAQQTATASAVALAAHAIVNGVVVTALSTNTNPVYVGPAGVTISNGYKLVPGQSIPFAVADVSAIYIIGTAGTDVINVAGN